MIHWPSCWCCCFCIKTPSVTYKTSSSSRKEVVGSWTILAPAGCLPQRSRHSVHRPQRTALRFPRGLGLTEHARCEPTVSVFSALSAAALSSVLFLRAHHHICSPQPVQSRASLGTLCPCLTSHFFSHPAIVAVFSRIPLRRLWPVSICRWWVTVQKLLHGSW